MTSYHCDPIGLADNMDIEQDDEASEASYGDTERLEDIYDLENDEVTFTSEESTLPRPPTKPNVYIKDETICPVCSQPGKFE